MKGVVHSAVMRSEPGHSIDDHVEAAIELAQVLGCPVRFVFNDTPLEVERTSDVARICTGWEEIKRRQRELNGACVAPNGSVEWGRVD